MPESELFSSQLQVLTANEELGEVAGASIVLPASEGFGEFAGASLVLAV